MKKNKSKPLIYAIALLLLLFTTGCDIKKSQDYDIPGLQTANGSDDAGLPKPIEPAVLPTSSESGKADKDVIILSDKTETLEIEATGRTSLFVPYREKNLTYTSVDFGNLPLPPISGLEDEAINGLVTAKVTGILYDPVSPSAIVNVLDEDYLVKPGDIVESFKITSITKNYVAIKTGSNTYRAKVGDIVDGELYGTGEYNVGHKFAGHRKPSRKEDIVVVSTKKKDSGSNTETQTQNNNAGFNELTLPPIPELQINKTKKQTEIPVPVGEVPKVDTN